MDETGYSDVYTNSIGMQFIRVPAGEFEMGSVEKEINWFRNEDPPHKVSIMKEFYLGKFPVTQKQWLEIMDRNPSKFTGEDNPVDRISWNDAQEFIKKLNEREETKTYRLPSEAEWEYACRAGTTTKYSFGDSESELDDHAFYGNQDIGSHPVGIKKPNPWGLYDMYGNVWEWMQDVYHDSYESAPADGSAREDNNGKIMRVVRGGSWQTSAVGCRSASRYFLPQLARRKSSRVGLRLVREI
ncbi:formylglycine-generating enzyme family protein [Methanolobus zinderi]|jgi:formylglycine-generating enzyme required for sulfatase activity|uniref:Formylglycine-generating enzyme family protein n=1 Tax=Methanolobus zinderi TaxID=536044 RepID=A0A7D5J8G8_9EURY|nr:formylglycine-generating enzyme family protein [Methanolobus zinderi]QLC49710.1 formylglycine-generating enzyme family protein [Methanolobus zinderi]